MKRKIIIFGTGQQAELAHFYLTENLYEVVAFCVDGDFLKESIFLNTPVISKEDITTKYPPTLYSMYVSLGYTKVNTLRKEKYHEMKNIGYKLITFIHPSSVFNGNSKVGDNCLVLEKTTIQPFVTIGNNNVIFTTSHIGHHSTIGNHCFIAGAIVSGNVTVCDECFLGGQAIIRDTVTIGRKSVIGMGAIILKDVTENSVYFAEESKKSKVPSTRLRNI